MIIGPENLNDALVINKHASIIILVSATRIVGDIKRIAGIRIEY